MPSARKLLARAPKTSALHVQVHFMADVPPGVTLTREFLNEVWQEWLQTGDTPKNIEVHAIHWRNKSATTSTGIERARRNLSAVFALSRVTFSASNNSLLSKGSES